jgi:hypothetical protein
MPFHALMAAAFGIWLGMQAFINIGVNMGLLPTKGLTLPLLSYGRSSLLVTLAWIGMLLRVHHEVAASGRVPMDREGRRDGARADHGWRHRRARVPGARRRAGAARAAARGRLARHAPRHRGAARARGRHPDRVDRDRGPARPRRRPLARGAVRLARALLQALAVLRRLRPGVVLGCGGFVSGPGGLAAWLTRTPLVIHEQNASPA